MNGKLNTHLFAADMLMRGISYQRVQEVTGLSKRRLSMIRAWTFEMYKNIHDKMRDEVRREEAK